MTTPVIKIAILLADTPAPTILAEHGDYLAMFTRLLEKAVDSGAGGAGADSGAAAGANAATNHHPRPSTRVKTVGFDVVDRQEYPADVASFDAVLITGSSMCQGVGVCVRRLIVSSSHCL